MISYDAVRSLDYFIMAVSGKTEVVIYCEPLLVHKYRAPTYVSFLQALHSWPALELPLLSFPGQRQSGGSRCW